MYIATFHTHYGAMTFLNEIKKIDPSSLMMPVPRVLSAACGVCIRFEIDYSKQIKCKIPEDMDTLYYHEEGKSNYDAIITCDE